MFGLPADWSLEVPERYFTLESYDGGVARCVGDHRIQFDKPLPVRCGGNFLSLFSETNGDDFARICSTPDRHMLFLLQHHVIADHIGQRHVRAHATCGRQQDGE